MVCRSWSPERPTWLRWRISDLCGRPRNRGGHATGQPAGLCRSVLCRAFGPSTPLSRRSAGSAPPAQLVEATSLARNIESLRADLKRQVLASTGVSNEVDRAFERVGMSLFEQRLAAYEIGMATGTAFAQIASAYQTRRNLPGSSPSFARV